MTRSTFPDPRPPEARERRSLVRWRISLKMALRQSLRSWPSSVLVILLVFLPIAGVSAAMVYATSLQPSPQQRVDSELGQADAWVQGQGTTPGYRQYLDQPMQSYVADPDVGDEWIEPPADITTVIDADEFVRIDGATASVETESGFGLFYAVIGSTWDPLLEGRYTLLDGRAPTSPDEMLATPESLKRIGAELGDVVVMKDPAATYTVVGTMSSRLDDNGDGMIFVPEVGGFEVEPFRTTWYVGGWHPSADDVYALNALGVTVFDRELVQNPGDGAAPGFDSSSGTSWAFYSATAASLVFCAYLVMLLAGAAFSVSAKRQQRALAVAASVGASRADVFRIVLFQGTILGLAGGILGSAAGIGLAGLGRAWFGDGSLAYSWGLRVPWWAIVGLAVFATVMGTLSALLPARAATRGDTLAALRGARRPVSVSAARPKVGLALLIAGAAIVVVSAAGLVVTYQADLPDGELTRSIYMIGMIGMIVGPLLLQVGVIIAGHWLLAQAARLLGRFGLGARLAARDAVANPGRSVPSFGAIAACAFLATASIGGVATLMNMDAAGATQVAPYGSVVASVGGSPVAESGIEDPLVVEAELRELAASAAKALRDAGSEATAVTSAPVWDRYSEGDDGNPVLNPDAEIAAPEPILPQQCAENPDEPCLLSFYSRSGGGENRFVVVAPNDLETAIGAPISAEQEAAFDAGAAVVEDPQWLTSDGDVVVNWWRNGDLDGDQTGSMFNVTDVADQPAPASTKTLDGILVESPTLFSDDRQVYIAPSTARALGFATVPTYVIGEGSAITTAKLDALSAWAESEALSMSSDTTDFSLSTWRSDPPAAPAPWLWLILGGVTVLVIAASAVSLGLSRVERRPDDATLTAVGAAPGVRRAVGSWQALVIAGYGCIVGTVAGLLPVLGVVYILDGTGQEGLALADVPWLWYGLLALALPLAVALVSWLVPPRAPDLTRRTAIA
ncbi:ABC transporter permease [Microbacterium sorbitolivorans]|uniref:ABC transporter permease n=1 Tax=Microbacterium sorbitolivorans TaxID=1867410 RepID=UPI00166CEEBC|nr:ABC transporter permease [Microbacterium sorbitolivorans]